MSGSAGVGILFIQVRRLCFAAGCVRGCAAAGCALHAPRRALRRAAAPGAPQQRQRAAQR